MLRPLPHAVRQNLPTNCFQACVATILGMPIERVSDGCDGAKWDWDKFQRWLATLGLQAIEINFANGGTIYPVVSPVRCVLTGKSPREALTGHHAVVADYIGFEGFELVHDPHKSDSFFEGEPTHATFFVPLNIGKFYGDERADFDESSAKDQH